MQNRFTNNLVKGMDNSYTLYNEKYMQSYHSKSMGAVSESLYKFIYPTFIYKFSCFEMLDLYLQNKILDSKHNVFLQAFSIFRESKNKYENINNINILDICFGLGINAYLAMQYFTNAHIYSPEIEDNLASLREFPYNFEDFNLPNAKLKMRHLLDSLIAKSMCNFGTNELHYANMDARIYIQNFPNDYFDIVFQDAFSAQYNKELWDEKYFETLFLKTKNGAIIATYAKARKILDIARLYFSKVIKYDLGAIFIK